MDDLFKEYLKEMEISIIHCDSKKLHIEGSEGALLSMYAQITRALAEDIDKKDLKEAFDYAFLDSKQLKKLTLQKLKKLMKEFQELDEEDEQDGE
jgi:hypothetical protein